MIASIAASLAIGIVVGLLLGTLGGGGSILTVPALVYAAHLAPKSAIAVSFVVVGVTSAVGAWRQSQRGCVRWPVVLSVGVATMIGAFGGARLGTLISGDVQLLILGVVMIGAAMAMLRAPVESARPSLSTAALGAVGLGVGVMTGLVGIGGGFLIVPALSLLGGLPMAEAVGTSLAIIAMNSAAGFVGTLGRTPIPWNTAAIVTAAALAALEVGTFAGRRASPQQLRRGFGVFLLLLAAFLVWRNAGVLVGTTR